jgi:hypothetical protein
VQNRILPPGLRVFGQGKSHHWTSLELSGFLDVIPTKHVRSAQFSRHLKCISGFSSTQFNAYHLSIGSSGTTGNHRIDSQATTHIQDFLSRLNVGMQMWIPYSMEIVDIWPCSFKVFLLVSQMKHVPSCFLFVSRATDSFSNSAHDDVFCFFLVSQMKGRCCTIVLLSVFVG